MNFLLHHHLAARDLRSNAAALGAMLPDVWRMADRRAHLRGAVDAHDGECVADVLRGVAHHVAEDARFHAAPVFTTGEQATRDALRAGSSAPKLALFAHIAWELCLDGALVRRLGLAPTLDAIRASLRATPPDARRRAARAATPFIRGRAGEEAIRFEARVDEILEAIARGPWVAGYATGNGIVERVEGVRTRLGLARLPPLDRDRVGRALEGLADRADAGLDDVLSWGSTAMTSNLTRG